MNLVMTTKVAMQSLITNKGRSLLTMLGVVIGVSAVILLVAIGNGLQVYIEGQFEDLGSNNIFIAPGDIFGDDGGFNEDRAATSLSANQLKLSDVEELRRLTEYVKAVSPMALRSGKVAYKDIEKNTTVMGVDAIYSEITNNIPEIGRFFSEGEANSAEKVAVLGYKISEELFGSVDPIGKEIRINNKAFTVLGKIEEKGSSFGGPSFDTYVYIPTRSAFSLSDNEQITRIVVQTKDTGNLDQAIQAVESSLLKRLDEEDFSVFDAKQILNIINQILGVLTVALGGIAAISLVVGGIGIMNIMLVSVTERTREIGLRKAIGATPNQILLQFLIEAVLLSVIGGALGISVAFSLSLLLNRFIPTSVSLGSVMLAFFVSAAVGIIFGVYPARRASKLSPIEALRSE